MTGTLGAPPAVGGAYRGLAWFGGALATVAAVAIGSVLTVVFAATVAVIGVMGAATIGLALLATRARRSIRVKGKDDDVLEARRVGGNSWVAYGWDAHSRS
jgi:hypothetical protein